MSTENYDLEAQKNRIEDATGASSFTVAVALVEEIPGVIILGEDTEGTITDEMKEELLEKIKTAISKAVKAVHAAAHEGKFDEALKLANALDVMPEGKQELIASIEQKKAEADPPAKVAEETKRGVETALKNGFHNKAAKIVKQLPKDHPYRVEVLEKTTAMAKKAKAAAAKKAGDKDPNDQSVRPVKQKVITSDELLADFQKLHDKLAKFEYQQKLVKKPFRHVVLARNRVKQFMMNFQRNCR